MGTKRVAYRILVGRPDGKRPLGRPRLRWEVNIKMYLQQFGWGAWTGLIWLRIVTGDRACEYGNGRSGSKKCGEFLD
jgi:hypothetical protein